MLSILIENPNYIAVLLYCGLGNGDEHRRFHRKCHRTKHAAYEHAGTVIAHGPPRSLIQHSTVVVSFDDKFTHLPVLVFIRDFNGNIFGFVFLVLTSCDTGRQVSRVLLGDSAQLTNVVVSRHQSAVRQLCSSGHNLEV